jgi:diguanylate cyclase (GGDEF)-like protein/PAS domain S-box-containing protein
LEGPAVGVLAPFLAGAYYGSLISAVDRIVSRAGGRVAAIQTARPGEEYNEGAILQNLARVGWGRLDGFVAIGKAVPLAYLEELMDAGKPLVVIANQGLNLGCPAVLADNRGGMAQAVEHLFEHGHTRIAFAGCLQQFDIQERYGAYRDTLVAHGLEPDPGLFFEAPDNVEWGGIDVGRRMLAAGLPSTAVVAATDLNAAGLMATLKEAGCALPQDQAVVGFDDMPGAALLSPSLSTVSQDFEHLGTTAGDLLMRQLSGQRARAERHLVAAAYVTRESCGCVNSDDARGTAPRRGRGAVATVAMAFADSPSAAASGNAPRAAELAEEVGRVYQQAILRELTAIELFRLGQACEELYGLRPSQPTYDAVLALANQLSSQLGTVAGDEQGVAGRLNRCTAQVRLGLTKALLNERNNTFFDLRRAVRDEYLITLDVLANREQDPRLLAWLGRTKADAAVLGLWRRRAGQQGIGGHDWVSGAGTARGGQDADQILAAPPDELDIVGTFNAEGSSFAFTSGRDSVELFPPAELLEVAREGNVVSVVPVISAGTDWGFLAVAAPVDKAFIAQDTYFMWAAHFAAALDHQELMRSLRESEERYALAARAANDGLWDWDLTAGTTYYSTRWKEMLGYPDGEIGCSPEEWLGRVHPDDAPELIAQLSELSTGRRGSVLQEHRVRAHDGSYLWALCRCLAVPGGGAPAARIVGSLTDVTERRRLEQQLRHQALYDSLTGLPNRVLFLDRLSQAITEGKRRPGHSYAVLWLDLDNFKSLNDSLGHLVGDQLLVQVAERVRSQLREADTAARFGGDEFAVLLLNVDFAAVRAIVRRLLDELRAPCRLGDHEIVVTASVGVVTSTAGYEQPEDVLRDADIAMYRAKSAGRGTYVPFDGPARPAAQRSGGGRCS